MLSVDGYGNMNGSLGEHEMLWEHNPKARAGRRGGEQLPKHSLK